MVKMIWEWNRFGWNGLGKIGISKDVMRFVRVNQEKDEYKV